MNLKILSSIVLAGLMAGCFAGGSGYANRGIYKRNYPHTVNTNVSSVNISNSVKDSLKHMYEEERLAKEVYLAIY